MKIVAVVTARMTSSRLPGKVLMELAGKPALLHLVERLRRSRYLDEVMVATSVNQADDPIQAFCQQNDISWYRGSEDNVLSRVLEGAQSCGATHIVRITGDCPIIDPEIVDQVIVKFIENPYLDFVANDLVLTYPNGLNVEILQTELLSRINQLAKTPADREHVTLLLYQNQSMFHLSNVEAPRFLRYPGYRLTLDTIDDYRLIAQIYDRLYHENHAFSTYDVIKLLHNEPELLQINSHVQHKKPIASKLTGDQL